MLRLALAAAHLVALGIGLGAVWARGASLGERPLTPGAARRAFTADMWWGIAAALWLATGLWRLFAGTEKAPGYYMSNHAFLTKMGLFALILALEIWPMITLIRWRMAARRSGSAWRPNEGTATRIRVVSCLEAMVLLAMVVMAVTMARGYGVRAPG